jgi:hypothetical protein
VAVRTEGISDDGLLAVHEAEVNWSIALGGGNRIGERRERAVGDEALLAKKEALCSGR